MQISLPIDSYLKEIRSLVARSSSVILTATPGAGKTTRLPPEFLQDFSGKILVLQPRRMAAIAAATRVAQEKNWRVGEEVGYQVRFESKISPSTRLIFLTDALAIRKLINDPELRTTSLVIIDEFHERNLNQDIMLGAVKELQQLGSSIKVLVMSATINVDKVVNFFDHAEAISIPGKIFPLTIEHSKVASTPTLDRTFFERMTQTILRADTNGDILAFLPGVGEIDRLRESLVTTKDIQILHGSMALDDQQRVLRSSTQPRIILATNVAEASVTVEGVDCVVDSGLAKIVTTDTRTGFSQLKLARISRFNANQRAGRAARQRSGTCYRMWTEHEELTMSEELRPECERIDLSQCLLLLAQLGVSRFEDFAWLDRPPGALLALAERTLLSLGALDKSNQLTSLGRKLVQYPLPPRWGAILATGDEIGEGVLAAKVCAILNEPQNDSISSTTRLECDLTDQLERLHDRPSRQLQNSYQQLEGFIDLKKANRTRTDIGNRVRNLLLKTQSDFLCRRRSKGLSGLRVGGRGVRLQENSQVKASEFFIALKGVDLPGQADTRIEMACGMDKDFLLKELNAEIVTTETVVFHEEKERFFVSRTRSFRDLPLDDPSLTPASPKDVAGQLANLILKRWDWLVTQNEALLEWNRRRTFFERRAGDILLSEENLIKFSEYAAFEKTSFSEVIAQNLVDLLEAQIESAELKRFKEGTPTYFVAPTGNSFRIDYSEEHAAYVEVRLQELFGLKSHPTLLFGALPITFRLLGPNFRPVQVTSDIVGFWKTSYSDVRKDLRARYPKHSWPEDPANAVPVAKGRRS